MKEEIHVSYIETVGILDTGIMVIVNVVFKNKSYDVSYWYDEFNELITYPDNVPNEDLQYMMDSEKIIVNLVKSVIPKKYDKLSDIEF